MGAAESATRGFGPPTRSRHILGVLQGLTLRDSCSCAKYDSVRKHLIRIFNRRISTPLVRMDRKVWRFSDICKESTAAPPRSPTNYPLLTFHLPLLVHFHPGYNVRDTTKCAGIVGPASLSADLIVIASMLTHCAHEQVH